MSSKVSLTIKDDCQSQYDFKYESAPAIQKPKLLSPGKGRHGLPEGTLNMGYASSATRDNNEGWLERMKTAIDQGLNVIFWFSINFDAEQIAGKWVPKICSNAVQGIPTLDNIVAINNYIKDQCKTVTHMVTTGGWGANHVATECSAEDMWKAWKVWNASYIQQGFKGFAGLDWDYEGTDDVTSPLNRLTLIELNLMGQISQLAKRDGFLVSMVPPESYLDPWSTRFDTSLLLPYPEWERPDLKIDFKYHGRNCYAYILAKYGVTEVDGHRLDTFDLVSIQLYESYSHVDYALNQAKMSPTTYFTNWIQQVYTGWFVDFQGFPGCDIPSQFVSVNPANLCIGLANGGWSIPAQPSDTVKTVFVPPTDITDAYVKLKKKGIAPRGFVFWVIDQEGMPSPLNGKPFFMTEALREMINSGH